MASTSASFLIQVPSSICGASSLRKRCRPPPHALAQPLRRPRGENLNMASPHPSPSFQSRATAPRVPAADVARLQTTSGSHAGPSNAMMAEYLVGFRRSLEEGHSRRPGEGIAAAGADVVGAVRAWLTTLHGHPQQGPNHCAGATWHKIESELEQCLWDLERDLRRIAQYKGQCPARLDVQLVCLHCSEAATLLRHL